MNKGRIIGLLILATFILGVVVYQVLQGPVLFADDFLTSTAANENQIITSILLGLLNGLIVMGIAVLMLPNFKQYNLSLSFLFIGLTIVNFAMIAIDNLSTLSILELSLNNAENPALNDNGIGVMADLLYRKHWWTHYLSLLSSTFYLFAFYLLWYQSNLIPRLISSFGMLAAVSMFIEMLASIYGQSISMNLMLPLAIAQLALIVWLLVKGIENHKSEA